MALKDIFKMTKANRYTQDGREELIKAQEAETEDRRYNIGEISEKTGLQKTANGWVKPKTGKAPGAKTGPGKSPDKQSAKSEVIKNMTPEQKEAVMNGKTYRNVKEGRGVIDITKADLKSNETKAVSKNNESKPAAEKKQSLKLPDEKSSFSTDVNRMKKLKKEDYKQYTIQLEKLHSKYPINKWKDLYDKTLNDEAPHVLTGDTRIRIRK